MVVATADPEPIGDQIRAARERLGWSQRYLARQCRVSRSYINDLESGRRTEPSNLVLDAVGRVLGIPLADPPDWV